mgnify:CR=1 FL=1
MVKVRNTRPVKKCINPESCKKLALILTCYHCASTRVKHLAEIQDYSQKSNYTGIKNAWFAAHWNVDWNFITEIPGVDNEVLKFQFHSLTYFLSIVLFKQSGFQQSTIMSYWSTYQKKTLTKKKRAHSKEKPEWKALFQAKVGKLKKSIM